MSRICIECVKEPGLSVISEKLCFIVSSAETCHIHQVQRMTILSKRPLYQPGQLQTRYNYRKTANY